MAEFFTVSATVPQKELDAFSAACRRFHTELGNSQKVAVRRGVLTLIRSLRARTLEAPKKSRSREFKVERYTGDGPRYVTNPRTGSKATHGRSNGLVLHRWTLTRRLNTPEQNTHHYFAYAHLKHNSRGKIVKDFAAERREIAYYHTGIKNFGLAKKSWGWFTHEFFGRGLDDGRNPKAKIRQDMVDGHFTTRKSGEVEMVDVLIYNKLKYIADAMKPGAVEEAMRTATKTINERIDRGFAKARKELD